MRASSSVSVASSKCGAKQCLKPALKVNMKPTMCNFHFLTLRETKPQPEEIRVTTQHSARRGVEVNTQSEGGDNA